MPRRLLLATVADNVGLSVIYPHAPRCCADLLWATRFASALLPKLFHLMRAILLEMTEIGALSQSSASPSNELIIFKRAGQAHSHEIAGERLRKMFSIRGQESYARAPV